MYVTDDSWRPEHEDKRLIGAAPLERKARMKWYVLTLFLVVGFVWSVSAQQPVDPKLVGAWQTHDGPCNPCTLTIPESGQASFDQAGSAVQVVFSRGTPDPGIDVILSQGGKLDLVLSRTGNYLVGTYTSWSQSRNNMPVSFARK
jgi:hypothetical protein